MLQPPLINIAYIVSSSILISGCALSGFENPKPINTTQIVSQPTNLQSQSIIILARPFSYSQALINYLVQDNDNTIGLITNNSYMRWTTNKGNVTLSLKPIVNPRCRTNDDNCLNSEVKLTNIKSRTPITEFTFNAVAGETYYLTLKPEWQFFTDIPGKVDIIRSEIIDLTDLKPPIIK